MARNYYSLIIDTFNSVFSSKHMLIINVYTLYLCIQLCRQAGKGWKWLFKLLVIFIIYLYYQKYSYGTYIFFVILFQVHRSLPSPYLPILKKAVIITGKTERPSDKSNNDIFNICM